MPQYDVWERDGATFRRRIGKVEDYVPIVDEVYHPGRGWTPYPGDRVKPAMFGDYLGRRKLPEAP
jgi:hypothetical protein